MKKLLIILLLLLTACTKVEPIDEEVVRELPKKPIPESSLMSDSPIGAYNIDEYLFIDDVIYIDTRSPEQFLVNGHIAGFINIPFYEAIAAFEKKDNVLFTTKKIRDDDGKIVANIGEPGSFFPNYEESEEYLYHTFPKDKKLVIIATAGVESSYLINLLKQYGYDASLLYNAGSMENSLGKNVAYFDLDDPKYVVEGIDSYRTIITYDWGELTPIE